MVRKININAKSCSESYYTQFYYVKLLISWNQVQSITDYPEFFIRNARLSGINFRTSTFWFFTLSFFASYFLGFELIRTALIPYCILLNLILHINFFFKWLKELARASIIILIVVLKITIPIYQLPKPRKNTSRKFVDTFQKNLRWIIWFAWLLLFFYSNS